MTKPITPDEVGLPPVPDCVFEVFNNLIKANFRKGGVSRVTRKEAMERIIGYTSLTDEEITDNGWLDIEPHYTEAGWKVRYESPDRGENFEPFFEFRKGK